MITHQIIIILVFRIESDIYSYPFCATKEFIGNGIL